MENLKRLSSKQIAEKFLSENKTSRFDDDEAVEILVKRGYRFSPDELNRVKMDHRNGTYAHILAERGYMFTMDELITMGNIVGGRGGTVAHLMAHNGYQFTFSEIMKLGNPVYDGNTIAHEQLAYAHEYRIRQGETAKRKLFTFDEMMQIEKGRQKLQGVNYYTLGHLMAYYGFEFSMAQLQEIGDYPDGHGKTISLHMAYRGHLFSFEEIMTLNNPSDYFGNTLAHWTALNGGRFSVEELNRIGNPKINISEYEVEPTVFVGNDIENHFPAKFSCAGATVAHLLALEGVPFTAEEIDALGNPKDDNGLTIADWMKSKSTDVSLFKRLWMMIKGCIIGRLEISSFFQHFCAITGVKL
jgi:hypothetical protein